MYQRVTLIVAKMRIASATVGKTDHETKTHTQDFLNLISVVISYCHTAAPIVNVALCSNLVLMLSLILIAE
jgi:hypothetical protein